MRSLPACWSRGQVFKFSLQLRVAALTGGTEIAGRVNSIQVLRQDETYLVTINAPPDAVR